LVPRLSAGAAISALGKAASLDDAAAYL